MFLNQRIEAWLYRITNTSNPEFKSDLDALNRNENSKTINTTFSYEKMVDEKNYRIQEKEKKSDGTENNRDAEKETDEDKADGKEREEKNDKQKEETQPLNGKLSCLSVPIRCKNQAKHIPFHSHIYMPPKRSVLGKLCQRSRVWPY